MNEIKKAVIMAAGKGERLRPITLTTPKPLICVNGKCIIETVINGLMENGISDICVVVGHLGEQFTKLKQKYPDLTLIQNRYYESCNNISSLYSAKQFLDDCVMLIDGDQMINDPSILGRRFDRSGYTAAWTDSYTNEWLMTLTDDIVSGCSRNGGKHGWQLYGVSRWTKEDANKLRAHTILEFETKQNRDIYWDDIPMFFHSSEYELGISKIKGNEIREIDTIAELAAADPKYSEYIKD